MAVEEVEVEQVGVEPVARVGVEATTHLCNTSSTRATGHTGAERGQTTLGDGGGGVVSTLATFDSTSLALIAPRRKESDALDTR
jgi:hypothetical protein